jgi:hypothetical protein
MFATGRMNFITNTLLLSLAVFELLWVQKSRWRTYGLNFGMASRSVFPGGSQTLISNAPIDAQGSP